MKTLNRWFVQSYHQERQSVFLEDALLGGRLLAYAWFRLRFFAGNTVLKAVVHLIEFTILSLIFSQEHLLSVLLIRTLGRLLAAWWWGALECMRSQLRTLHRQGKSHLMSHQLPPWFALAAVCSSFVMLATLGWILLDINRPTREFGVMHLYILAIGLRLSLALMTQTYHASVYAIRRVYRPFIALIGIPLLGFWGTLITWPALGHWAFPTAVIPTIILSSAVTCLYVYRMYRFLGLRSIPFHLNDAAALKTGMRYLVHRNFQAAGFAYASTRLDELLTLSLIYAIYQNPAGHHLVIVLYLISPFSRATYEWARLWYFDFKKLEPGLFASLRRQFDKFSRYVAWGLGGAFWVLACLVATCFTQQHLGALYVLLLVFFLVRSHFALYQIQAFSDGRYGLLIMTGLLTFGCTTYAYASSAEGTERLVFYVLVLIVVMLLIAMRCAAFINRGTTSVFVSLLDWLRRVNELKRPVRIRSAWIEGDVNHWLMDHMARQILRAIRTRSAMTIIGKRRIVWYEYDTATPHLTDAHILASGNGWIGSVQGTGYGQNGTEALAKAQQAGVLGRLIRQPWQARQARDSLSGIVERFRSTIPNGVMFDPTARRDSRIDTFSSAQRRELLYGAVAYTRKMFDRHQNRYFDVTALIADGKLRLIFGAPIDQDRKIRSNWRSYMNTMNVAVALGAQIAEESKNMFPLVCRRTLYVAVAIAVVTGLYFIPMNHSVTGVVHLRPTKRAEIRAPVAGFLEQMNVEQGTQVVSGGVIARLEVPDLQSQIAGQHASIESMQAKLRLLQAGPRPERVAAQRELVGLTEAWRNQAQHELQQAIEKDVQRIAMKINEYRARMKLAREEFELSKRLIQAKTLHTWELRRAETEQQVWESQYQQAVAEQEANASMVVLRAVSEIVEREQDVAEAHATLTLLEAGYRPEMIDMTRADLKRLEEELAYFTSVESKLELRSPIDGTVMTADVGGKEGRYYEQGEFILEVANASVMEAEITISEKYRSHIASGQRVVLKIHAQPYQTLATQVERISPAVEKEGQENIAKIYGTLKEHQSNI